MLGPLIAFGVGLLAAVAAGGRLERLATARFRVLPLLWASLLLPALIAVGPDRGRQEAVGVALVMVSNLLLVTFALFNRDKAGLSVVALGVFLNAIVISLNGGMPVSPDAARQVTSTGSVASIKHEVLTNETRLPWLADRIPIGLSDQVWSLGDLVMVLGIGVMGFTLPRRSPAVHSDRARDDALSAPA